ncbi:YcxB family protein [Clostridium estertheticum]|uniref:YcxB family protein n=1 Tax=Clostridium estertheticum TaxID=238834 RepID=UPI001C0A9EDF|nr:YcxB family protein [Clostridium estertheticum]MBU3179199.1 YcxB family protein [Clostridium estertheticum]
MEIKNNEVKIITQITYDIYKKYCRFGMFRGRLYKVQPILIYIIGALIIPLTLYLGFTFGFNTMDIVAITVLPIIIILISYSMFIAPKVYYKSAKNINSISKYNFSEEYMTTESTSKLSNGFSKIMYSALHRVYEIDDLILIFISKTQAFIIPKKDCSSQNIIDLRRILQSKTIKYKNYSKKH